MTIQFGGLATGIDTNSLISELISAERGPINRLETDKAWMSSRLDAFKQIDSKLDALLSAVETLEDSDQYYTKNANLSSEEFFSASASNSALAGTSYQIEVVSLAKVQKSYTETGFDSQTDGIFGTGTINLDVGGEITPIDITEENNSLEGIMAAINEADVGISANIIYNGSQYMLTFTGENVGTSFSVDSSGLTGGNGTTLGAITTNQPAERAHLFVDGIEIYSDSNTVTSAIPGVTLDLTAEEPGTTTQLTISEDNSALKKNIEGFVKAYNYIISFIGSQSTMGDTDAGILNGDSGVNQLKRSLQNFLTTFTDNEGAYKTLSQLGLETQKDGTVTFNSKIFGEAVDSDFDSIVSLVAGTDESKGVAQLFGDFLEGMTSSTNGFLAGREKSINANIERIDKNIELQETRLLKREETLRAQFTAMEQLVSVMNAQSTYLTQQLSNIASLGKNS